MNEKHNESLRSDIEREYRIRKLLHDDLNVEKFLDKYKLDANEKQRITLRLKMWEERFEGFEDYYNAIDFDIVFDKIMGGLEDRNKNLWDQAIQVVTTVGKTIKLELGLLWEPVAGGTLSESEDIISNIEESKTYRLKSGPLMNTEVELGPNDKLIIRLNRPVSEDCELRFIERDGKQVDLPAIYELDQLGKAIYDLSDAAGLPPFEIRII